MEPTQPSWPSTGTKRRWSERVEPESSPELVGQRPNPATLKELNEPEESPTRTISRNDSVPGSVKSNEAPAPERELKLVTWNVNSLRQFTAKLAGKLGWKRNPSGALEAWFGKVGADIVCFQVGLDWFRRRNQTDNVARRKPSSETHN
jgi:hypothetical protein